MKCIYCNKETGNRKYCNQECEKMAQKYFEYYKKYKILYGIMVGLSIVAIFLQIFLFPKCVVFSKMMMIVLGIIFFIFPFGNTIDSLGVKQTTLMIRMVSIILIILGGVSIIFNL